MHLLPIAVFSPTDISNVVSATHNTVTTPSKKATEGLAHKLFASTPKPAISTEPPKPIACSLLRINLRPCNSLERYVLEKGALAWSKYITYGQGIYNKKDNPTRSTVSKLCALAISYLAISVFGLLHLVMLPFTANGSKVFKGLDMMRSTPNGVNFYMEAPPNRDRSFIGDA